MAAPAASSSQSLFAAGLFLVLYCSISFCLFLIFSFSCSFACRQSLLRALIARCVLDFILLPQILISVHAVMQPIVIPLVCVICFLTVLHFALLSVFCFSDLSFFFHFIKSYCDFCFSLLFLVLSSFLIVFSSLFFACFSLIIFEFFLCPFISSFCA